MKYNPTNSFNEGTRSINEIKDLKTTLQNHTIQLKYHPIRSVKFKFLIHSIQSKCKDAKIIIQSDVGCRSHDEVIGWLFIYKLP